MDIKYIHFTDQFTGIPKVMELDYTLECISYVITMARQGEILHLVQFNRDNEANEGVKKVLKYLIKCNKHNSLQVYTVNAEKPAEELAKALNCTTSTPDLIRNYKLLTLKTIAKQIDGEVMTPTIFGQDQTLGKEIFGESVIVPIAYKNSMADNVPQEIANELMLKLNSQVQEAYGEDASIFGLIQAYSKYLDKHSLIELLLDGEATERELAYFRRFQ